MRLLNIDELGRISGAIFYVIGESLASRAGGSLIVHCKSGNAECRSVLDIHWADLQSLLSGLGRKMTSMLTCMNVSYPDGGSQNNGSGFESGGGWCAILC